MKRLALILGGLFLCSSLTMGQRVSTQNTPAKQQNLKVEMVKKGDAVKQATAQTQIEASITSREVEKYKFAKEVAPKLPLGNVNARSARKAVTPNAAPWRCNFDSTAEFKNNWIAIDKDGDTKTWQYTAATDYYSIDGSQKGGVLLSGYNAKDSTKNILITKNPVTLEAGKAHVSFMRSAMKYWETLTVYYSKELDESGSLDKLTKVGSFTDSVKEWKNQPFNFDLAEAGNYYFYFFHTAAPDQFNLVIDNLEIGQGDFVGEGKLAWMSYSVPMSSCGLGNQETIGFTIKNVGNANLTNFKVRYSIDGGDDVEQTFTDVIEPLKSKSLTFTTKADFSGIDATKPYGKKYQVVFKLGDDATAKGVDTAYVTNFAATNIPYSVSMAVNEENEPVMDFDTLLGYDRTGWTYNDEAEGLVVAKQGAPLVTRCMNMKAGVKYRMGYTYQTGGILRIFMFVDDYDILFGKAGTDIKTWDVLKSYRSLVTSGKAYDEFVVETEEDGAYAFAIVHTIKDSVTFATNGSTIIYNMMVEEVPQHDIELVAVGSSLAAQTPVRHAAAPVLSALVENRGYSDEAGVKVTAKWGETTVAQAETSSLESAADTVLRMLGTLNNLTVGQSVKIDFAASMTATDMNPNDNTAEWSFMPTDGLYAFDKDLEDFEDGLGVAGYTLGQVFTLKVPDTLIELTCGWMDMSEYVDDVEAPFPVALEVYPITSNGLGECFFTYTFNRQIGAGYQTIQLPARVLSAGRYFVALRQVELAYGLWYDNTPGGVVYARDEESGGFFYDNSYGYPALRIKLGHPERLVAKDIEILSMSRPKDVGQFTANEVVEIDYRNNGVDAMEVTFTCSVDGVDLTPKTQKVQSYGEGKMRFTADLSKRGLHEITVTAVAEGDEDAENNVVKRTVKTLVLTPYEMNFEFCSDFAIDGDLAPWKGVDMDGDSTYASGTARWPHAFDEMAFMAFNPVLAGGMSFCAPHSGDRVGTAWCPTGNATGTNKNNDWLVSPKLKLPETGANMSFYVNSVNLGGSDIYTEKYEVWVSETDNQITSFTQIGTAKETVPGVWTKEEVDLSAYNGKEVHLAIRCVSDNQWIFLLDDIEVSGDPLAIERISDLSAYVKSYPNPVKDVWTVITTGIEINRVELFDMMGGLAYRSANNLKSDSWSLNMSGFKPGLYTARVYTSAGVQTIKVTVL